MYKDKFKMDLQLFADEEPEETPPTDDKDDKPEGTEDIKDGKAEDKDNKTFNQDDVNDIVSKRLAKERAKFEKDFKDKLALEKKEAERLAKLSKDEREIEELRIEKEKFNKERLTFEKEKIELQVTKELAKKGLPITFANLLVTDDADTSLENIKSFEKDWQEALEKAVVEKLKGTSPKTGGTVNGETSGLGKRLAEQRQKSQEIVKDNPYF